MLCMPMAAALWALAWLGTMLSMWTLLLSCYLAAFTLPALYCAFDNELKGVATSIYNKTLAGIDKFQMPKTTRLLGLTLVLIPLFFTTWTQFGIGCFVAVTYWRTTMAQNEIDAVRSYASPYTQSRQQGGQAAVCGHG
eukprot:jgi/Chrzof1/2894/Cz12g03030.t1